MILRTLATLGVIALVCGTISSTTGANAQIFQNLPPVQFENRVVTAARGKCGTLTLNEPEVWLDADLVRPATKGLRFPSGEYDLEAEDADYFYYRAPERIEARFFQDGRVTNQKFIPGGIYVSKAFIALVPAGVYQSGDDTHKTLIWKLGSDFMRSEGTKWTRTKIASDEADK
jgi:hypothetical protein